MVKKIFLHVGTPKTGTTSIQTGLIENADLISKHDFIYPDITGSGFGWRGQRGVSTGNASLGWSHFAWKEKQHIKRLPQLLDQTQNTVKCDNIILSSEDLARLLVFPEFWEILSDFSVRSKINVDVVLYLRDPFSMFLSCYEQRVKTDGFVGRLSDFVSFFVEKPDSLSFNIHKRVLEIIGYAKQYNVNLLLFRYENSRGKILKHFLSEACNLNIDIIEQNEKRNVSLNIFEVEFFRGINSVQKKLGRMLGYDFTDMVLASNRKKIEGIHPYVISADAISVLERTFHDYEKLIRGQVSFHQEINYEIDFNRVSTTLSGEDIDFRQRIYDLGVLFANSYTDGYLNWQMNKGR